MSTGDGIVTNYGFNLSPDGRPVNFEGCPVCTCGPFMPDCNRCGGLGIVPSQGSTGPGTYHVLTADPPRCWCRPPGTTVTPVEYGGAGSFVHWPILAPPGVMEKVDALFPARTKSI